MSSKIEKTVALIKNVIERETGKLDLAGKLVIYQQLVEDLQLIVDNMESDMKMDEDDDYAA